MRLGLTICGVIAGLFITYIATGNYLAGILWMLSFSLIGLSLPTKDPGAVQTNIETPELTQEAKIAVDNLKNNRASDGWS